ncbi:hypothetical protein MUO32_10565 [Shinella sp. CPCC 101442]|uniref:hypothetical protein n=1 Tax=Shinella sp. CPCC 101442 TaxID=2932265 RepID=UPI00215398DA|nr:hypothetical protein [Shinella sp. CPCC 101442]MCR6499476.1 hypothetical protein [Shinella sp. CPCC 101442]
MAETVSDIRKDDWFSLRDYLGGHGWDLSKGGGLDHSWATLRKGQLQINMEYDAWAGGEISFPASQKAMVCDELPVEFVHAYDMRGDASG